MAAMNPELGAALQNPQMRAMLQNPDFMRRMADPNTMQVSEMCVCVCACMCVCVLMCYRVKLAALTVCKNCMTKYCVLLSNAHNTLTALCTYTQPSSGDDADAAEHGPSSGHRLVTP